MAKADGKRMLLNEQEKETEEDESELKEIARMMLKTHNVLAKVELGSSSISLEEVALHAKDIEYDTRKGSFAAMYLKRPAYCSARLYSGGSLILNGAPSEMIAKQCTRKLARRVQKASSCDICFRNFRITNMLVAASCGFPIDLEGLHQQYSSVCDWEPERTPGLVASLNDARCIVHGSGKVSISGCRSFESAVNVFAKLYPMLQRFRKGAPSQGAQSRPGESDAAYTGPAAAASAPMKWQRVQDAGGLLTR